MATHSVPPSNGIHSSQHANLRILRGSQPGLLDSTQPSRLLRFLDSKLSFASFDPKTAIPEEHSVRNSGNITPPKRIVIETTAKGASFWRFVPRARLEEGTQDEGVWPRVINICGEMVQCYQEQWEIHKLDPKYRCTVYPRSKYSTIVWVDKSAHDFENVDPHSCKRSRSPETSEPGQKKARSRSPGALHETGFDSDEDEVEEMIIDEPFSQKPRSNRRSDRTSRNKIMNARLHRWAKNRMACGEQVQDTSAPLDESFSMRVDSDSSSPQSTRKPAEENVKRKEFDYDSDQMLWSDQSPREPKRARASLPETRKHVNHARHKRRLERLRHYADINRQHQRMKQFADVHSHFVPPDSAFEVEENATKTSHTGTNGGTDDRNETPEAERLHEAEIAESIRKLRELERDRPLWEAQRKQREARERAEEQERLLKAEQQRREEEQRLRQQRETAERERRHAQQEAEKRALEEELRQREYRQQRQRQRWESGLWTTHRALERYRMLSDEFDTAKFTPGQSIAFHDIPWPVLHAPSRLTVEDVDWSAVETFFATVKPHMRMQDYKEFVEKSHRRFHPDRWRARKIWAAVTDEVERGYLEVAANTVAQALTPIWRAAKEN